MEKKEGARVEAIGRKGENGREEALFKGKNSGSTQGLKPKLASPKLDYGKC